MDSIKRKYLMLFNSVLLAIGATGGPLLLRLYFVRGGKRIWLSSALGSVGWPILILPLSLSYIFKRGGGGENGRVKFFTITLPLIIFSAFIGLLLGLNDYLYSHGVSLLPVSTSTLIMSTHLAFTAGFAFVLVKQKFTPYSTNAVVLLTVGAVLLGLHSNGDKPINQSNRDYYFGFFLTVGASVISGLLFPIVTAVVASLFCVVGMITNNDFKAIPRESKEYELGEVKYYLVLEAIAIMWQIYFVGTAGVIFCSTSLLAGIITAVILPVTEILSVVFYHESFKSEKGIALFLSFWGLISYLYGDYRENMKLKKAQKQSLALERDENLPPLTNLQ
uniref:Probable purine permease n=1 Tax=Papaver somniferum TaxID=3469 RepID=A0A5B7LJN4_PAPSO|nr:PUP9-like [Papaver somniferum]